MPSLIPEPIKQKDIDEYLENYSDFSFEMQVCKRLRQQGFKCQHTGTYSDPITQKLRQYDIHAELHHHIPKKISSIHGVTDELFLSIFLSVECKNIREESPVIGLGSGRTFNESYHYLIVCKDGCPPVSVERRGRESYFQENNLVIRSLDQVGRFKDGKGQIYVKGSDKDIYTKLSQATSSTALLAEKAFSSSHLPGIMMILPVLVVPNDRLWQVCYDQDGNICAGPEKTKRIDLYIGHDIDISVRNELLDLKSRVDISYTLSHQLIVTVDGLAELHEHMLNNHTTCFHHNPASIFKNAEYLY